MSTPTGKTGCRWSSDLRPGPTSRTTSAKPMFPGLTDRGTGFVLSTMEIVVIDRTNSILLRAAFTDQLRQKSRHRRDRQERLAQASIARPRRNDILPGLELSYIPIADLRPSPRKVRKLDPAHVREVASSISALGFCVPLLVGRDNEIIHGEVSCEAAKQLGLDRLPCVRIGHLSPEEQRVLRLAVNRLAEKGEWNLDALKIEFDELIVTDAPIEITGFSPAEIDHVILGDATEGLEEGPLEPDSATAVARVGDIFQLGQHRIACGDATDPSVLARLLEGDASARLVLTDEPYNVKVAGNVTRGDHREFAISSGEMTDAGSLPSTEPG
jgi:ParB-like nuclease domain